MSEELRVKWKEYHRNNPHIYDAFEELTLEMTRYRKNFSARAVMHKMRWDTAIRGGGDDFKLPNWVSPYMVRLFEERHSRHIGFFRTADIGITGSVLS